MSDKVELPPGTIPEHTVKPLSKKKKRRLEEAYEKGPASRNQLKKLEHRFGPKHRGQKKRRDEERVDSNGWKPDAEG